MEPISLSVVVPVFHGARFLPDLASALSEVRAELAATAAPVRLGEAIFVDDGSIDDSPTVLENLNHSNEWIHVITLSTNFGQHPATIAGILHSSGDWVASMDEDFQHRPNDLIPLLKYAIRNGLDIVYAKPKGEVHRSRIRDLGSRWFKQTISRLIGNPFIPLFNSFRMMRGSIARAAAAVCENDPYFDIAVCWFTHRIGVLPLDLTDRRFIERKESGYKFRTLVRHAERMLSSSEMKFLRLGAAIGVFALTASIVLSVVTLGIKVYRPSAIEARGWASLVLLISFFGGLTSLLTGILTELTTSIVIRLKGKPTFFVVDRRQDLALTEWARHPAS
jgi:glycosyltransferase involved in cell wall biosynthesis